MWRHLHIWASFSASLPRNIVIWHLRGSEESSAPGEPQILCFPPPPLLALSLWQRPLQPHPQQSPDTSQTSAVFTLIGTPSSPVQPPYSLTPSAVFLLPCLLQPFLLPADMSRTTSVAVHSASSLCGLCAHIHSFPHFRCLGRPTVSMAFLHGTSPPPRPPCLLTQVNSHVQHTWIVTSHTSMHAHAVPEPPVTFLPLSPRSGALL